MNKCVECGTGVQCECFMFDTDYGSGYFCSLGCYKKFIERPDVWMEEEFGKYEGHYSWCEYGGHFKQKWNDMKQKAELYEKLYHEFHKKWKDVITSERGTHGN